MTQKCDPVIREECGMTMRTDCTNLCKEDCQDKDKKAGINVFKKIKKYSIFILF